MGDTYRRPPAGITGGGGQVLDKAEGARAADEAGRRFRLRVQLLDMNGDGETDLASGAPDESKRKSVVWVLPGSSDGLTGKGARVHTPADVDARAQDAMYGAAFAR